MRVAILGKGRSGQAAKAFLEHLGHEAVFWEESVNFDLAVVSPGIRLDDERCERLRAAGVEVIGELELGLRYVDRPAVGVTGTNGKSTTTELIAYMCDGVACGNNGYALTKALLETKDQPLVIEMSSFQLETAKTVCLDGAVILNVTPDHLDRYENFDAYRKAKERIRHCVKEGGVFVRDVDIEEAAGVLSDVLGKKREKDGFKGLPHRLEDIGEIRGVRFINDSKGTNVEATLYALKNLEGPLILLAGGLSKGGDFSKWSAYGEKIKKCFVFGSAAGALEKMLGECIELDRVGDMNEAMKKAFKEAGNGDTIVLSPGCSSFDQFRDFEERGDKFKDIVRELRHES